MTEFPVLSLPFCEEGTALDAVTQILDGVADLFEEADRQIAKKIPAPMQTVMCGNFMPGMQGLVRATMQLGIELREQRKLFMKGVYDAQDGAADVHGPCSMLVPMLKLRGIVNAIAALGAALVDAAEAEAIGIDHASAALCAGAAFVDEHGRVIARTSSAGLAKTSLAET